MATTHNNTVNNTANFYINYSQNLSSIYSHFTQDQCKVYDDDIDNDATYREICHGSDSLEDFLSDATHPSSFLASCDTVAAHKINTVTDNYTVVTREIKLFRNNSKIISVFYFTCNQVRI